MLQRVMPRFHVISWVNTDTLDWPQAIIIILMAMEQDAVEKSIVVVETAWVK